MRPSPIEASPPREQREESMKQVGLLLVLTLATMPSWGAKKVTVAELKDTLITMHQAKKSDAEVAGVLKQLELSEELTRSTMNSVVADLPGPLSTEQIYVLEASSANLAPPPSDIPGTAAPDAAAQKAMRLKQRSDSRTIPRRLRRAVVCTAARQMPRSVRRFRALMSSSITSIRPIFMWPASMGQKSSQRKRTRPPGA